MFLAENGGRETGPESAGTGTQPCVLVNLGLVYARPCLWLCQSERFPQISVLERMSSSATAGEAGCGLDCSPGISPLPSCPLSREPSRTMSRATISVR